MRGKSLLLLVAGVALLMTSSPTGAQNADRATVAMKEFLESWLVYDDIMATAAHFGASERSLSLAPTYLLAFGQADSDVARNQRRIARAQHADAFTWAGTDLSRLVALGYWQLFSALWPDAGHDTNLDETSNLDGLLETDSEWTAFIDDNFNVEYIQRSPFIVFRAEDRGALDALDAGFADGGYGRLAEVLQPTEDRPILTMIAGFSRVQSKRNGPLVTFWDQEMSDGRLAWRIQALGAFPQN